MKKILTILIIVFLSTVCFAQDSNTITVGSSKDLVESQLGTPTITKHDVNDNEIWIYENTDNIFNVKCSNFGQDATSNKTKKNKNNKKQLKTLVIKFDTNQEVASYSYNIVNY